MKLGKLIFAGVLLLITTTLWIVTMTYPLRSKLFPLFALSTALILLIIQTIREIANFREKEPAETGKVRNLRTKYFAIFSWLVGTLIMLWVLGFMGTVVLLPFIYLRFHRESWLISILLPFGCGIFFYLLFDLALNMSLYPGILFSKIFD